MWKARFILVATSVTGPVEITFMFGSRVRKPSYLTRIANRKRVFSLSSDKLMYSQPIYNRTYLLFPYMVLDFFYAEPNDTFN